MPNFATRVADDITTQTVNLLRMSEGIRADVLRDLTRLENNLTADVRNVVGQTAFTQARLRALLAQTRATIATAYDEIAQDFAPMLQRTALVSARTMLRSMNTLARVDLMSVALSKEQLVAIAGRTVVNGKFPAQWWHKQDVALRERFSEQMRQGQYRGESVDKLVRRVRGTRANGFTDGVMQASRRQAEALVRTSVIAVANEAKLASYIANRDVIKSIQWVARLDNRTTEICIGLNGKIWELPPKGDLDADYVPVGHTTPFPGATAHWNCRSVQVPITYSIAELAERADLSEEEAEKLEEEPPPPEEEHRYATEAEFQQLMQEVRERREAERAAEAARKAAEEEARRQRVRERRAVTRRARVAARKLAKEAEKIAAKPVTQRIPRGTGSQFGPKHTATHSEAFHVKGAAFEIKPEVMRIYNDLFAMHPQQFSDQLLRGMNFDKGTAKIVFQRTGSMYGDAKMELQLTGKIEGESVVMSRYFDSYTKQVNHHLFTIPKNIQKRTPSVGKQMFRNLIELYDRAGIGMLDVGANIDVGSYAWARYGFTPTQYTWERSIVGQARDRLTKQWGQYLTKKELADVEEVFAMKDPVKGIRALSGLRQVMNTGKSLGFELMKNGWWDGALDMNDPAAYEYFYRYVFGIK